MQETPAVFGKNGIAIIKESHILLAYDNKKPPRWSGNSNIKPSSPAISRVRGFLIAFMTAFYTKSVGVLKLKGKYYFTLILRKNDVLKGIMVVGL